MTHKNYSDCSFAGVEEKLKDLPVNKVVDDVIDSVKGGNVTVLTAETGSGKTLVASSKLADASDGQVVVLVPRRFLAINAAQTIAELSGTELGKEVGYAIGRESGDLSNFSPDTKLVFATYGYALSSGLLDKAKTIVLDEVHEKGVSTSLARSIIHDRLKTDKNLKVLEMSATLDAEAQAGYWRDAAKTKTIHAEGKSFECDCIHDDRDSVEENVLDLITDPEKNRKGVAVFRAGVGEVKETANKLQKMFAEKGITDVEISTIYADMSAEDRAKALEKPAEGNRKILIGTNVIESGMNIPWLDSGVSDGKTKVPYYRDNGAKALVLEDLPQWRITQQEGRIKRFCNGIFVLASEMGFEERELDSTPEITRVSLNNLVLQAANYGKNPEKLYYDAHVKSSSIKRAKEDLMRLKLINDDYTLTEKGKFAISVPLEIEPATMLWQAPNAIQSDITILAAIAEIGDLRNNEPIIDDEENKDKPKPTKGFGMDQNSDLLDAFKAFKELGNDANEDNCKNRKVSWKKYNDVKELVDELNHRRGIETKIDGEQETNQRPAKDEELVQAILQGNVNHLFNKNEWKCKGLIYDEKDTYFIDKESCVNQEHRFATVDLRELQSGKIIAQNVTNISTSALLKFAKKEGLLSEPVFHNNGDKGYSFTTNYCGKGEIEMKIKLPLSQEMKDFIEPKFSEFKNHGNKKQTAKTSWVDEATKKPVNSRVR